MSRTLQMRKPILCMTVALAIAGCAADRQDAQLSSSPAQTASADALIQKQASPSQIKRTAFASLPDRGTLLAFEQGLQPIHRGADTYHAVKLSEAHAFNAAAPGKSIELPTPSGGMMKIDYQRIEEGLDGNWSWVGKTQDGLDAVITFGEKAVFGRIAQRDTEALRLTMSAGRSWLVETDPSKLFDGNLGRDADESDALIPPSVAAAVSAKKLSAAAQTAVGDAAVGPATTVDVVLGFTDGMVTKYGSVANANTRLANLMALTNQAYVNSQVTSRVRLVRTVQISYTDTNSNETTLEALTGYTCTTSGCSPQTVPTALVPLRTARDTYGGDLVSLVRPFQAPQHQGCGIAWLLGGGGFTIDNTDAPFGYSVVSDGSDKDETDGRTYFCREETLAHELGHNMGQQHNTEDSGGDSGTHAYSYGYRESITTGFYTVMAYRLANSSQFSISYFGNPSINYADTNRPTGTATADNARSLNLSMPLVVQFRAAVVAFGSTARNDFNGDGLSEIYWKESATGESYIWRLNARSITASGSVHVESDPSWKVIGFGDFNGDGRSDVFWRHAVNGQNYIHLMDGLQKLPGSGFSQFVTDLNWEVAAIGDFDGDGDSDLYWKNSASGACIIWYMQGLLPAQTRVVHTEPDASWKIAGTGDFNGDGISDILWRHSGNGTVFMHRMSATGVNPTGTGTVGVVSDLNWQIVAIGDFNGDGNSDIYWRHSPDGLNYIWTMNGLTQTAVALTSIVADQNWKVVSSGDYNGDGKDDIFWRNSADGSNYMHLLDGSNVLSSTGPVQSVPSLNWKVMGGATFD